MTFLQHMNPGPYAFHNVPIEGGFAQIGQQVEQTLSTIPALHQTILQKLEDAEDLHEVITTLNELEKYTRIGDMHVLRELVKLDVSDIPKADRFMNSFLMRVRDPQTPTGS